MSRNIGAAARAMLNFGLTDLRLVSPQADWCDKDAHALAAGAAPLLEQARCYDHLTAALADCDISFATTARPRDMVKEVFTPSQMVDKLGDFSEGAKAAFVFGREKSGMENEHISLCDAIVSFPINPAFASLNLAQAVVIMAYQWRAWQEHNPEEQSKRPTGRTEIATKASLFNLFDHLEGELEASGFLRVPHKKALMVQNIRSALSRCYLTEQEVQTIHGMISCLAKMSPEKRRRRSHRER